MNIREARGCTTKRRHKLKLDPVGGLYQNHFRYEYEYCPVNYVQPQHKTLISLYSLWKQGKMLDEGGIGDQNAVYIDVMQFFDTLWAQAEREAIEESKNKK